jgi:predicted DNA-binding helix-hairpin-helix protein
MAWLLDAAAPRGPALHVGADTAAKLDLLAGGARYDISCACGPQAPRVRAARGAAPADVGRWVYPAVLPDGRRTAILKVLLTNACAMGCRYCAQSRHVDGPRAHLAPEEVVRAFLALARAGRAHGLFLSSAIPGKSPDRAMEGLLAAARTLRRRGFQGYLHLKVLPGVAPELIEAAAGLATRLSVNLEAPTAARLREIAPEKDLTGEVAATLGHIARAVRAPGARARSHTTQLVVGAGEERDRELLRAAERCYEGYGLERVYYSAFQPVPGSPLAARPPAPPAREHRLYQADFLLRRYGFRCAELVFDGAGQLASALDPKEAWARAHPELFPLEAARAPRALLLRVPGIGPHAAARIVARRGVAPLRRPADLGLSPAALRRAAPYLLVGGRPPAPPRQLELFAR